MTPFIDLTHAVLNRPISVMANQIFGIYYSDQQKSTILLSTGSTSIPVKETPDEIKMLLSKMQEQNGSRVLQQAQ